MENKNMKRQQVKLLLITDEQIKEYFRIKR